MRSDMAKVVTERPRRGHGNPSKKWGRRLQKHVYDAEDHRLTRAAIARRNQYRLERKRSSPTFWARSGGTCISRSDALGTRSGRTSHAISTAVH